MIEGVLAMRAVASFILAFALISASSPLGHAQGPTQSNQEEGVSIGTTEITLDVVVRDKSGHLVKNLTAADFEVLEENTPQEIASFRLVTSGGLAPRARPRAARAA